ncbi:MarR family winged helix-turn-helix transcriptional regulator [Deinococcus misasensis]|uniref:MarR family winged helix-turn-helix transcriptional regulator n=1 Tax=Deinococcus misasensis TaxID=392413 RepID=UPI0005508AD2|nr:MarR family transcriptional regulator [Deinococcus misasensis]
MQDLETRLSEQDPDILRLWLRWMTCTNLLTSTLRARFKEEHQTTVPRFDLLIQLEPHQDGLGAQELARRLMVTPGNITVITDQLAQEGLVVRSTPPADRRSVHIQLTEKGREHLKAMTSSYQSWLSELFSGLSAEEHGVLLSLLARLKGSLLEGMESRNDT